MFEFEVKTTRDTKQLLKDMPKALRKGLIAGMNEAMKFAKDKAKKSFGSPGKPNVVTGKLRESIKHTSKIVGTNLIGTLTSDRIYARIQEEGGVIKAKGGFLRFPIGGSWVSVESVTIPRRSFLRPAIQDNLNKINQIITDSVSETFERL